MEEITSVIIPIELEIKIIVDVEEHIHHHCIKAQFIIGPVHSIKKIKKEF